MGTTNAYLFCGVCGSREWGHLIIKCAVCSNAEHRYCMRKVLFHDDAWLCDECLSYIYPMDELNSFEIITEIKHEVVQMEDDQPFIPHVKEEVVEMVDVQPFRTKVKEEVEMADIEPLTTPFGVEMVGMAVTNPVPEELIQDLFGMSVSPPTPRRSPRKKKLNQKYFSQEMVVNMNFNWLTGENED
ncbi:unnamed protein product [Cuscuta epithymum]|uniref:PHD-type domain-containing protein n=1 Tax=Cuscuta epithymum TaxID=186058 RepID=A0AAV0G5J1_9ASTE|nr:unnamed protein product [Cuscuta epithymum]